MSKSLIIAEKPSVGKEIAKVLGCKQSRGSYMEGSKAIVTWAYGHLVTHGDPEVYDKKYVNWHLEDLPIIPDKMKLVVIKQTGRQFNAVKDLLKRGDVKEVVIATDAGREGELVARWILEKAHCKKPVKRLWISSVTDKAIKEGFKSLKPGKQYEALYRSAVARAEGDWIVGINATRALTTKFGTPLSCGRVQTPTLAMVKAREDKVQTFVPKKYYGITLDVAGTTFTWQNKKQQTQTFKQEEQQAVYDAVLHQQLTVTHIKKQHKKTYADKLYDLTTLQRESYDRYGYSPKQTLSIMQRLYETHKVLTYPRTDSNYLTSDMAGTIRERLEAIVDNDYKPFARALINKGYKLGKHIINDGKVSDHHAIIPTEVAANFGQLSREEWTIYEMVVVRFLALLMPPYQYDETVITASVNGHLFTAKEKVATDLGFKALWKQTKQSANQAIFKSGQKYAIDYVKKTNGQTSPPAYFNEGTLLTAMENPMAYLNDDSLKKVLTKTGGIGTVATRADIIDKLINTGLISLSGKALRITNKGKQLLNVVPEALKSPRLTAEWELKLDDIAKGKASARTFSNEIKRYTHEIIDDIKGSKVVFKHDNLTNTPCPDCGKKMFVVENKRGKRLKCQDRNCGYSRMIERVTNARCPECKKKLILRSSESGKLFTCKCGFKESEANFDKRMKKLKSQGGKGDYIAYQKKMAAEEKKKSAENNPFAQALAGLKFDNKK